MTYEFAAEEFALVDMDGVLSDFAHGISTAHGRPYPYDDPANLGNFDMDKMWGMTRKEFFAPCDHDFWARLPKYPEADEIVHTCLERFGAENIAILSDPGLYSRTAMTGKHEWLERHFPMLADGGFLFGRRKQVCANPFTLLIDDYDKNVENFAKRHGNTFLVPRPWNKSHHELDTIGAFRTFIANYSPSVRLPNSSGGTEVA